VPGILRTDGGEPGSPGMELLAQSEINWKKINHNLTPSTFRIVCTGC